MSLNRGTHNIRSGLDMRWTNVFNENYNNSGGILQFHPAVHAQHAQQHRALEGNAFASFLLGAPNSGTVDVNPKPHYQWFFAAPWIQDDWRVTNKLTLNLGFRWDINGSVTEENNMLNYAFDPTIVNPVSARVGQPVMGGIRFAGVDGAPDRPWKLDKDNWQGRVGMAYSINEKTVLRAGYGKYFLNPTGPGQQCRVQPDHDLITSLDGGRTPTYALSNPWPNGIQTPPGSSLGPRHVPRAQSELLEPRLRRAERAPVLRRRPARAAVERLSRHDLRGKPQLRPGGRLQRLQRAVGGVPGAVRRDARRQPQPSATSCCRTRSIRCPASRARRGSRTRRSRASS